MLTMSRSRVILIFVIFIGIEGCFACFTHNRTVEQIVDTESTYYIDCICQDETKTNRDLEWRKEGKKIGPMGTQEGMHTEYDHSGRQLDLYIAFNKAAEGSYECVSTDRDGRYVSVTYLLYASAKLYFYNTNTTQYIVEGQDSLLTCEVRSDQPVIISWYRNQNLLMNDNKYSIESNGLRIKNVKPEDEGVYNCSASGSRNGETVDQHIKAEMLIPPLIANITAYPSDIVVEGDKLMIQCNGDGYPEPKYQFIKIPHSNNIEWTQDYDTIIIDNVTEEHRGVYECTARNEAGLTKKQITIEVLTKPIIVHFRNETVLERSEIQIQCKAMGRPRPQVFVNKVDSELSLPYLEQSINEIETEFNLIFNKVLRNHSGFYYCNASNKVDFTFEEIYLNVLYKPSFVENEEELYMWAGKEVILNCDYDSVPESEVSWKYYGKLIEQENRDFVAYVSSHKEQNLNITNSASYGTYECIANNSLGSTRKTFKVKEGFLPPKFDISKVTISDTTATSVVFVIEDHYKQGPKLTGYIAEYDLTSAYEQISVHPTSTWAHSGKYILFNLKPGNSYTVRFAMQNEMGDGEFSDAVTFDTPDKSVPEQLKLEENSDYIEIPANQKYLKLRPPEDNGSPITYYTVQFCIVDIDGECITQQIQPTTEVQLDYFKLKPNTTYFAIFDAYNSLGKSESSIVKVSVIDSDDPNAEGSTIPAGAIIGISIIIIVICILIFDLLLYFTIKKGITATCCQKKEKKRKEANLRSKDKKGLLKDTKKENDALKIDNDHKEFEYNKETGVITGKHSAV